MSVKKLNEYYAEIAETVLKLVQEQRYQEALDIVDEELQQPYIPVEFFHNLNQIQNDIQLQMKEENYSQKIQSLTKLQVWDKIYDEKKHTVDDVYFNVLLDRFDNKLDDVDLSLINKIFCDKKVDNVSKSIIVSTLKELQIDYNFDFYNNFLNKTFQLNPIEQTKLDIQMSKLIKQIENKFMKYPAKNEIALSLLQVLATKFIPTQIEFNNGDIINSVINITNSLFSDEKIIENEIFAILKEYIY